MPKPMKAPLIVVSLLFNLSIALVKSQFNLKVYLLLLFPLVSASLRYLLIVKFKV